MDARRHAIEQADLRQLGQTLVNLDKKTAGGDGHNHVIGCAPAELFSHLEPERFAALRVVRAQVHVDECPAVLLGNLGTQTVHVIIGPVHLDQRRAVSRSGQDLSALESVGNEHTRPQPGPGGVGRHGIGQVACRSARHDLILEPQGRRDGDCNDAIFERPRGIHRVVLDVQLGQTQRAAQPGCAQERRVAGGEIDIGDAADWKERLVPPDRRRSGLNDLTQRLAGESIVVVDDLQWAETLLAHVDGPRGIDGPAFAAAELLLIGHQIASRHGVSSRQSKTESPHDC